MSNKHKYDQAFISMLRVSDAELPGLTYQSTKTWDSVGHMGLMAALEESFGITLDTDDIIDFSSYEKGKQILAKYNVAI